MSKKRFLLVLLTSLALIFTVFAGCSKNKESTPPASSVGSYESVESSSEESIESMPESEVESEPESEVESELESEIESEVISRPDNISAPTFSFSTSGTINSIILNVTENDPYDVGHITEIVVSNGSNKIVLEDMETRVIEGLYSGVQYAVSVTYTYDIGAGPVTKTYKRSQYTANVKVPTVNVICSPISDTSFSFELEVTDPNNVFNLTGLTLLTEDGEDVLVLDDLTQRVIEDVESGKYLLEVKFEYDLNKGQGSVEDTVLASVSTVITPLMLPDFIVEVPEGRDVVILQLSDTQIIDASQARPDRTGVDKNYTAPDKMEDRLFKFLRETINATKPDLILITGDLVYGEFDDAGTSLIALINAMESFQIPWAPVFGNHDNESKKGVDWQCEQLENAEYCLFKQRELSGNGNYTVGIAQGGELTRVFFMMDSNGCGAASAESLANGHTYNNYVGFKEDQVAWFMEVGTEIKELSPETKISFAFHIQMNEFKNAYAQYGYTSTNTKNNPINIDAHPDKKDTDFGYLGADMKGPWDVNNIVFKKMVSLGVDSIYVGHEHNNSASVVYNGIRFQYSQKISTYDRCNWLTPSGDVVSSYPPYNGGTEIMGGTVNVLDETGAIVDGYIYYCGGVCPPQEPPLEVGGLNFGSSLTADGNLAVARVAFEGHNSYEVTALGQGKFYVAASLLANKSTFKFTVYVPSTSTALLGGYGEFAIRVKANNLEPVIDSKTDGYIKFMTKANKSDVLPELEIIYDQWVTYTIDISGLGSACTEWAILVAAKNVIYLRDIEIA